MVLKYITKNGTRIHEPPYTQAEEDEFYRRIGGRRAQSKMTVEPHSADRKSLL